MTKESRDAPKASRQEQVRREVAAANRSAELGDMSDKMEAIKKKMAMMEKAQLMAEFHASGRTQAGSMSSLMAMLQGQGPEGAGAGQMPGLSLPFSRPLPHGGRGRFDSETFKKLMEMSLARDNPDAVYADIEAQAEQLVSKAGVFPEQRVALLIAPAEDATEDAPEEGETRELAEPDFEPIKFGFATMVREKPVLDGTIGEDEWPLDRPQYARQHYHGGRNDELPEAESVPMWIQWDPSGLYIAAEVPNSVRSVPPGPGRLWSGDGIEVWVDTSTARGPIMKYYEAIQMFFAPYGTVANKDLIAEFGHGFEMRGMPNTRGQFFRGGDADGMQMGMQETSGGYTVELFMPHNGHVIKGPKFKAGKYLGFQISFNHARGSGAIAWVMRGHHTWERPDTWGDLLLLGSDAEVAFYEDEAANTALDILSPGEPVWIQIHDPDMNLSADFKDQIVARVIIGSGGYEDLVVLGETGPNRGIFVGGVNTSSAYVGLVEDRVPVEPGKDLKVIYIDQRRDYGESNKTLKTSLPVAWPSLRFGQAN